MNSYNLYEDIKSRTGGDIYMGVVGPVRCGKSTFITSFMNKVILPNLENGHDKTRTIDELPQSADGKTVMTTQPRFIPKEAVSVKVAGNVDLSVRLVDCVGYPVNGAEGLTDNGKPRLVKTPWSDTAMPFGEAATLGTKKVITDHSTVAVVMTTDGSFGDLKREDYIDAEEQTIKDLKACDKPFVICLNTMDSSSKHAKELSESLKNKYNVPVVVINALELTDGDVEKIFSSILSEFPLCSLRVRMPDWMRALSFSDELICEIVKETKALISDATKIGEVNSGAKVFSSSSNFKPCSLSKVNMGEGIAYIDVTPNDNLFYKVLSRECGTEIESDFALINLIKKLSKEADAYSKLEQALEQVEQTGYGVVTPSVDEMTLEEPEIVKQGSRYGVRLKASAPSLHIMKVDVQTEISPIVGSEQQSEDLVKYLIGEFESNPKALWETNMFGKSLHSLVSEGLNNKIVQMPLEAQKKMRKTLTRIVNEGKGGIICILL